MQCPKIDSSFWSILGTSVRLAGCQLTECFRLGVFGAVCVLSPPECRLTHFTVHTQTQREAQLKTSAILRLFPSTKYQLNFREPKTDCDAHYDDNRGVARNPKQCQRTLRELWREWSVEWGDAGLIRREETPFIRLNTVLSDFLVF